MMVAKADARASDYDYRTGAVDYDCTACLQKKDTRVK